MVKPLDAWRTLPLVGTESQVEWAERIRSLVAADFDRVSLAFRSVAGEQRGEAKAATTAILSILDDKRAEVMSHDRAGYFIHDWQEMDGKVRELIGRDARYRAIQEGRPGRKGPLKAAGD
jgi:hypothetical protein